MQAAPSMVYEHGSTNALARDMLFLCAEDLGISPAHMSRSDTDALFINWALGMLFVLAKVQDAGGTLTEVEQRLALLCTALSADAARLGVHAAIEARSDELANVLSDLLWPWPSPGEIQKH